MRMGRPNKKRRTSSSSAKQKQDQPNKKAPKYSSPTLVVGQVSSNVIHSVLAPALTDLAVKSVESFADEVMQYEQAMVEFQLSSNASVNVEVDVEVEVDPKGDTNNNNNNNNDHPTPPAPPSPHRLFTSQSDIDELTSLLTETSLHFSHPSNHYKIHANAAKFERLLDEKYGRLRPFITSHPELEQFIKTLQRKYAMGSFSPLRKTEPPVSKTTSIMILFMMHRNGVRAEAVVLAALFSLVGLQPWALVAMVALGKWMVERRKKKRINGMPGKCTVVEPYYARSAANATGEEEEEEEEEQVENAKKYEFLERPVGTKFNAADLSLRDEKYNVILLGSGPEVLYTASLLARAGRKTLVLCPMEDASGCISMSNGAPSFDKVPFDVDANTIAHLTKQQSLLAPALVTNSDTQGGIRFARIGSNIDGYAHTILSVPGLGTDSISSDSCIPIVLNADKGGPQALAEYAANCLGDGFPGTDLDGNDNGNSTSMGYLAACRQINAGSGDFYLSKLFPSNGSADKFTSSDSNVYQQASMRPASAFLNKCLPLNTHVRSLMAAIGMAHENASPDKTSMAAHVTNVCALTSEEGLAYPVGGPRALCHALASAVEQCGGRVITGVSLQELLFDSATLEEEDEKKKSKKKEKEEKEEETTTTSTASGEQVGNGPMPRCKGVRLENGLEITVSSSSSSSSSGGAVISMVGLIPTFLQLLPPAIRTANGVPRGLAAISERRPLMKILVGLKGNKEELDLTGADWYRLPNATVPRDELDPLTGQVKFGTIGVEDEDGSGEDAAIVEGEDTESTIEEANSGQGGGRGKRSKAAAAAPSTTTKTHRSKFTSGASWMKVSFPSAKDPSWADRHGAISTCVVTIEADDDFVRMFDTKPKIYSILKSGAAGDKERLRDRVLKDLVENFPQLDGKIECVQIYGPSRSGVTHNPARFAIKGNRPEMPYPGLYIGGAELTVGDSFSGSIVGGWLAANAIMGYSFLDHLYLKKNITSDLEQFLEEPSLATERKGVIVEDLAVPFKELVVQKGDASRKGQLDDANPGGTDTAAESSKEE